jgi:hypothetical protein
VKIAPSVPSSEGVATLLPRYTGDTVSTQKNIPAPSSRGRGASQTVRRSGSSSACDRIRYATGHANVSITSAYLHVAVEDDVVGELFAF